MRRGPDIGGTKHYPARTRAESLTLRRAFDDLSFNSCPHVVLDQMWDFCGKFASGFGEGIAARITGSGPPTVAQIASPATSSPFGEIAMTLEATSQVQFAGVDFTDQLQIPAPNLPMLMARGTWPASTLTANEDVVIGYATQYNSTLASIAKYIRFRLSGSNSILIQGNDGTSVLSVDTGVVAVAGGSFFVTIEQKAGDGRYYFFMGSDLIGALALPAFVVGDLLQPLVGIRKASGTTTSVLKLDFLRHLVKRF